MEGFSTEVLTFGLDTFYDTLVFEALIQVRSTNPVHTVITEVEYELEVNE